MKFQQTSRSAHGYHGPRAEGLAVPPTEEIVRSTKDLVSEEIESRHPGLQELLHLLKSLMGPGSLARAAIPEGKLVNAVAHRNKIEEVAADVRITATTFQSVQVLHKILALGLEAALDEGSNDVCGNCEEVIFFRDPTPSADGAWLHLQTGKFLCADGVNFAVKRRRRKPRPVD